MRNLRDLLANIFLHHVLDLWLADSYPHSPFERYADDVIVHCRSEAEARNIRHSIEERLHACKLEAHPQKTKSNCLPLWVDQGDGGVVGSTKD